MRQGKSVLQQPQTLLKRERLLEERKKERKKERKREREKLSNIFKWALLYTKESACQQLLYCATN